jgi:hypothetical protein
MKKFVLFVVLLGVFVSVLISCGGKKEEIPVAEAVEEEEVAGVDNENEVASEPTTEESETNK